tara:strand:- start:61 stop:789 length:729 start_codon:yes stop_codon:yes gene_type:complete
MITKKCRGYNGHHACAEDYPDHILPIENFTKYHHRSVDIAGRCKVCVHYQNQIVGLNKQFNPRTNAISAIAYGYVGGSAKFYNLSKKERSHYRHIATLEYWNPDHIGLHFRLANEPFRQKRKLPKVDKPKGKRVTIFKPDGKEGYVYVFRDNMKPSNYYKVGASYNPQERLEQANTWGDFECLYPHMSDEEDIVSDCLSLEKEVHEALSQYKVKGEWFQVDKTFIINKIRELVDARKEQAVA